MAASPALVEVEPDAGLNGNLSVTAIASFVGLRQCGRYLRLTFGSKYGAQNSTTSSISIHSSKTFDHALSAEGRRLEDDVAAMLHQVAPNAPCLDPSCAYFNTPRQTSWQDFKTLIARVSPSSSITSSTPHVVCWAAEVALRGRPTPDSVLPLSGRADFILLLWRSGRPVLRLVECKATSEFQTKHLVQLVLYRMMLLQLLAQEGTGRAGGGGGSGTAASVRIGKRRWLVPGSRLGGCGGGCGDGGEGGLDWLEVECLLHGRAGGDAVTKEALPWHEVDSLSRQLEALLLPGGRIALALQPNTPLHDLPYELDSHCTTCEVSARCWADAAARGAVQLAGCSARQAAQLAAAGVGDIEDLAALAAIDGECGDGSSVGGLSPAVRDSGDSRFASRRNQQGGPDLGTGEDSGGGIGEANCRHQGLETVAAATGIPRTELERLALFAAIRSQRRLRLGSPQKKLVGRRLQFALLPGAAPTCLPRHSPALVRVYLSVVEDVVLKRVVGVAAHVVLPGPMGRTSCDSGRGSDSTGLSCPAPQSLQRGKDVVMLLDGANLGLDPNLDLDPNDRIATSDAQLDAAEARLLAAFSRKLCAALDEPLGQSALLHLYVHSHSELRALIRCCLELDHLTVEGGGSGSSDGGRAGSSSSSKSGRNRSRGSSSSGDSGNLEAVPDVTDDANSGLLAWLPHLLGQRADAGEQQMVSVMEDELRRYATPWEGHGRASACRVAWGDDGIFSWQHPPPSAFSSHDQPEDDERECEGEGGDSAACSDLQALFAAGGYLDALQPYDPQSHRAVHELGGGLSINPQLPGLQPVREHLPPGVWVRPGRSRGHAHVPPGHRATPFGTSSPVPESAGVDPQWVQVRPDAAGRSIPPCFFRALWKRQQQEQQQQQQQQQSRKESATHHKQQQAQGQPHLQYGLLQRGADRLPDLLLAQAHAVRWLEERLAALAHSGQGRGQGQGVPLFLALAGMNADVTAGPKLASFSTDGPRKSPLCVPLGPRLLTFRLDAGALLGRLRHGNRLPNAVHVARAAVDAVCVDRGAELRRFWTEVCGKPPAARAWEDHSGTLVLDQLCAVKRGDGHVLQGRVAHPKGCSDWTALCEMTGLKDGDGVVAIKVTDSCECPDVLRAQQEFVTCVIKPCAADKDGGDVGEKESGDSSGSSSSSGGSGSGGVGGLWVECHRDFMIEKHAPEKYGFFLKSSSRRAAWHFAPSPTEGRTVASSSAAAAAAAPPPLAVLYTAPNISAWIAFSTVEALHEYGGSSAYLSERLWLPPRQVAQLGEVPSEPKGTVLQAQVGSEAAGSSRVAHSQLTAPSPAVLEAPGTPPTATRPKEYHARAGSDDGLTPNGPLSGHDPLSPHSPAASSSTATTPSRSNGVKHDRSPSTSTKAALSGAVGGMGLDGGMGGGGLKTTSGLSELIARVSGATLLPDQQACVAAFLSHPDAGSRVLLQGPPGTGKTETVAMALLTWLAARMRYGGPMGPAEQGGVVLLSGPTHTAIDTLMGRIAERLRDDDVLARAGAGLTKRVELVRLGSQGELTPLLKKLGAKKSLPTRLRSGIWYVVGGTLRALVKSASNLRAGVPSVTCADGQKLMSCSGLGAFAAALILDEASMVFAPHLLALGSLLVARGSLLVAGDHRQLSTILQHEFEQDLRPNFIRHLPYKSAYDYLRLLADGAAMAAGAQQQQLASGMVTSSLAGGPPPPVSVCALTYTHRLPAPVTQLISPLYYRDGIVLRGRDPEPVPAPSAPPPPSLPPTPAAQASTPPLSLLASKLTSRRGLSQLPNVASTTCFSSRTNTVTNKANIVSDGGLNGVDVRTTTAAAALLQFHRATTPVASNNDTAWRRLWCGCSEGLSLVVHNEEGSSRLSQVEVGLVQALLEARVRHVVAAQQGSGVGGGFGGGGVMADVAILTPHRAQRRALRTMVAGRGWSCRVDTVDRMQGGEADVIIFSTTVSDTAALERCSEFYTSISRANVAFSRTRRRLIVLASRAFLTHMPPSYSRYQGLMLWRQLRSLCESHGSFLGEAQVAGGDQTALQYAAPLQPLENLSARLQQLGAGQGQLVGGNADEAGSGVEQLVDDSPAALAALQPPMYRCDVFEATVRAVAAG